MANKYSLKNTGMQIPKSATDIQVEKTKEVNYRKACKQLYSTTPPYYLARAIHLIFYRYVK